MFPSETDNDIVDRSLGALVGLAVGDAVGTTLEFSRRDAGPPLEDMLGGGPFKLEPGYWTDDTSMALCLAESLLSCGCVDPKDLMSRFVRWWRHGENSCTGECFDIGMTIRSALTRFEKTGDPIAGSADPMSAGNGSLMRVSPVAIFYCHDVTSAKEAAVAQSITTHAAPSAVDACVWFVELLIHAIRSGSKAEVLAPAHIELDRDIAKIAAGSWKDKSRDQISSSGYVVHTLEAALWCVDRAEDFEEAVLIAANLGDDADTVAAVTGQLAGAIWGCSNIPSDWIERLAWGKEITQMANDLFERSSTA